MKKKKWIYWLAAAVVLVIAVAVLATVLWANKEKVENKPSEITAVYLSTGDIYFGKMDWFPWPRLKNVWYIQRGVDQKQQPQVGLASFKDVFWTPIDEVYLNPKEIVFWTMVKDGSQLAQALQNPDAFRQAQTAAQGAGTIPESGKGSTSQPSTNQ